MKKVLLTGISGYIGQHCAAELIKQGYSVRGSVRSMSKKEEVIRGIKTEVNPEGKLELCELNLLKDEGWDEAMEGCDYVLHVASPFMLKVPKDENELIKPAVEGTQRAMKAAKKAGIKKVVLTSSMVAMLGDGNKSMEVNENTWTNVNAKKHSPYNKSKTLAEKSAWDFINNQEGDTKMELTVINPGPVYGPTLNGNISGESMHTYAQMIQGKMPMVPKAAINMSDVRDIATIHVKALENRESNGKRFIVATEKPYSFLEMTQILKSNGYKKVSTRLAPNFMVKFMAKFNKEMEGMLSFVGSTYTGDISNTKKVFNWSPIPFEKTVKDTAEAVSKALK